MLPLKILHVIWSAEMGGISKVVLHLCKEQKKDSSLEVSVYIAKGKGEIINDFINSNITLIQGNFKSGISIHPKQIRQIRDIMSGFDIIHFHAFNPTMAFAAKLSRKKIIYTEHGNFGLGRGKKWNDYINQFLKRFFLNRTVNHITFNSAFTQKTATKLYGLGRCDQSVVFNGVPLLDLANTETKFRKSEDEFIIYAIGRLAKVKRFDRLIHSLAALRNLKYRLIILGDGPEEKKLKQMAIDFGVSEFINFAGRGDALSLHREADLCVLPSQGEAFGLVAIEAYQFGKRVLVFHDGGGVAELVKKIDPLAVVKNENELAQIISIAITNKKEDIRIIDQRKSFAALFSMEKMASSLKNIYLSN